MGQGHAEKPLRVFTRFVDQLADLMGLHSRTKEMATWVLDSYIRYVGESDERTALKTSVVSLLIASEVGLRVRRRSELQ